MVNVLQIRVVCERLFLLLILLFGRRIVWTRLFVRDAFSTAVLHLLSCIDSINFGHWTIIAKFLWFNRMFVRSVCNFVLSQRAHTITFTYTKLTRNTYNWILHSNFIIWSLLTVLLFGLRLYFNSVPMTDRWCRPLNSLTWTLFLWFNVFNSIRNMLCVAFFSCFLSLRYFCLDR